MLFTLLGAGMLCTPSIALAGNTSADNMTVASAQQAQGIKGSVIDAKGEPLIGATIKVVGTQNGTVTDLDGKFSINCKTGATLEISFIGYKTIQVKASNGMTVKLEEDGKVLQDVVVTALGIKRDRKALGYGLTEVKGEELTKAKETNVINSLAGKVAGLVVNQTASGASGSTRVQLRGATEMTGNNQPLYVVDGVPLDNTNFGSADEQGGYDLGDGISAINPDDIETMTVLKGPAASALYGSRASHGVILITTKKADKDKISVEYNGSFTLDSQLAKWDNIQTIYGMGDNGEYQLDASSGTNQSWGAKADEINKTYFDGSVHPFYMYANNVNDFFRNGLTAQNTAVLSVNSGKTGIRFSLTDMRNRDILPNTDMNRDNFNLRVNTSVGPVDFDFNANYTHEGVNNRPALGDSQSNVGKNLMTLASTYNQEWLKNYQNADGTYANWNGNDQYNKNPYWDLYKNQNTTDKDVFRLTGKAVWNVNKHLKLQGTVGTDINKMNFEDFIARSTPGVLAGKLTQQIFDNNTLNAELLALYNNTWDKFDFNATLGGNIYKVDNKTTTITGTDQQMNDVIAILNYAEQNVQGGTYKKQINSIYGSASVGFDHTYYLEGTLRGDRSSTLPVSNNTYVYPSVSGSVVFSEYIKNKKIMNYGKFRASWAKVGTVNLEPYRLQTLAQVNSAFPYGTQTAYRLDTSLFSKDLKPEFTNEFEVGTEFGFFNNRITFEAAAYIQRTTNQTVPVSIATSTGFSSRYINAGTMEGKGLEFDLRINPIVKVGNFSFNLGMNATFVKTTVIELADDSPELNIESNIGGNSSYGIYAIKGKAFPQIKAQDWARDPQGRVIVDKNTGLPQAGNFIECGTTAPTVRLGITPSFRYKNWRLNATFDYRGGHVFYSGLEMSNCFTGSSYLSSIAGRQRTVFPNSVYVDDNGNYVENTNITINAGDDGWWNGQFRLSYANQVYSAATWRLRELSLNYEFPKKLINKIGFIQNISTSLVGRNLFMWRPKTNIFSDPEFSTNGGNSNIAATQYNSNARGTQGGGQSAGYRSFGFNVVVTF